MTAHELDYVSLRSDADKTLTEYHPQRSRDRASLVGGVAPFRKYIYIYISEKNLCPSSRPYICTDFVRAARVCARKGFLSVDGASADKRHVSVGASSGR